jgi:hypothetical protein
MKLPICYGFPYVLTIYFPFKNGTVPSVNNNLLPSYYNKSTRIFTIQNVGSIALAISGFYTSESIAPVKLFGNLSYQNNTYFYFPGYDITMTTPRKINIINLFQSNNVVG